MKIDIEKLWAEIEKNKFLYGNAFILITDKEVKALNLEEMEKALKEIKKGLWRKERNDGKKRITRKAK